MREFIDYYYENGVMVFTEQFHLDRGKCCKSGCRHCPWKFKRKPQDESKRKITGNEK